MLAQARHVDALARLRLALLDETGGPLPAGERADLLRDNAAFYRSHLAAGDWWSWVVEFDGEVGAVGTLALWRRPPYPGNPGGRDAYLLNMYTAPAYRGRGAARSIVLAALAQARSLGVRKVVLHATEAGRPLYLRHGFTPSSQYMELSLTDAPAP